MANENGNVFTLAGFDIGVFEDTHLGLFFHYATSEEKQQRGEFEAFVIAIERDFAVELGKALIERAQEPYSPGLPQTRQ
jgi:hypothetical protein